MGRRDHQRALALTKVQSDGLLDPSLGWPILLGAVLAVVYAAARGWRPQKAVWAPVVTLLVLWFTTALSNTPEIPRASMTPAISLVTLDPPDRRLHDDSKAPAASQNWRPHDRARRSDRAGERESICAGTSSTQGVNDVHESEDRGFARDARLSQAELQSVLHRPQSWRHDQHHRRRVFQCLRVVRHVPLGLTIADPAYAEAVRAVVDNELQRGERLQLSEATRGASPIEPAPTVLRGAGRIDKGCELLISADVVVEASRGHMCSPPRDGLQSSRP